MEIELIKLFASIANETLKKMPNYDQKQWSILEKYIDQLTIELNKPFYHEDINKRQDPRVIVHLRSKIHAFAKTVISNLSD